MHFLHHGTHRLEETPVLSTENATVGRCFIYNFNLSLAG